MYLMLRSVVNPVRGSITSNILKRGAVHHPFFTHHLSHHNNLVIRRYYSTASFSSVPSTSVDNTDEKDLFMSELPWRQYKLEASEENLPVLKVHDLLREAETYVQREDRADDFDIAETVLLSVRSLVSKHNITDNNILGRLNTLFGLVYHQQFKYQDAIKYYTNGLSNFADANQEEMDLFYVGMRQANYAEVLHLAGQTDAAEVALRQAIATLERQVGAKHEVVGLCMNNLASFLQVSKNLEKAIPVAEKALEILEISLGRNNEQTRQCALNLHNMYQESKNNEKIKALDKRFTEEETPAIPLITGQYSSSYLDELKEKWIKQGPRSIFDPPGLHRSAKTAAASYAAFLKQWQASGKKLEPYYLDIITDETESINFAHDVLPSFIPRTISHPDGSEVTDVPESLELMDKKFEHIKFREPVTSLAAAADSSPPPIYDWESVQRVEWTEEEKQDQIARMKSYTDVYGDGLLEAEDDEYKQSILDFAPLQTVATEPTLLTNTSDDSSDYEEMVAEDFKDEEEEEADEDDDDFELLPREEEEYYAEGEKEKLKAELDSETKKLEIELGLGYKTKMATHDPDDLFGDEDVHTEILTKEEAEKLLQDESFLNSFTLYDDALPDRLKSMATLQERADLIKQYAADLKTPLTDSEREALFNQIVIPFEEDVDDIELSNEDATGEVFTDEELDELLTVDPEGFDQMMDRLKLLTDPSLSEEDIDRILKEKYAKDLELENQKKDKEEEKKYEAADMVEKEDEKKDKEDDTVEIEDEKVEEDSQSKKPKDDL